MALPHLVIDPVKRAAEITGTGQVVWDPPDGKIFIITEVTFTPSANCTFTLYDETDSTNQPQINQRVFKGEILADTPTQLVFNFGWPSGTRNNRLFATTTAGTVSVQVVGYEM